MNRRTKIIVSVSGIFIVLLALIGLTYAYFLTRINGNTSDKSISVNTANLELTYGDGSGVVTASDIMPGTTLTTKSFVVTNNSTSSNKIDYVAILEDVVNDFERTEDIEYTLECTSYSSNNFVINSKGEVTKGTKSGMCDGIENAKFPTNETSLMVKNSISKTYTHYYKLTITYLNPDEDQSVDMAKSLSAKVNIANPQILNPYKNNESLLAYNVINNSMLKNHETEFLTEPKNKPGNRISSNYIKGEDPTSFTSTLTNVSDYYISYASDYIVNPGDGYFMYKDYTKPIKYSEIEDLNELVGKYVRWATTSSGASVASTSYFSMYKVSTNPSDITSSGFKYQSINWKKAMEKSDQTLSMASDENGVSYYYRGSVVDNYLNFNNMCFRIVRIEGDGSVKLILEDQDEECSETMDGNWNIVIDDDENIKLGNYGYEYNNITNSLGEVSSSKKYTMNYLNPIENSDSSMVVAFENFQNNKLNNSLDKLKNDNWCINDKAYNDYNGTTLFTTAEVLDKKYSGTNFYYDSQVRLYGKNGENTKPKLKCNGTIIRKYIDNNDMYVGALTADEIVYAGAKVSNDNYYYYLLNNYQKSNQLSWWSLSPGGYFSADSIYFVNSEGKISSERVNSKLSVRPAITLASGVEILSGDGTINNPYTIK